MISFVCTGALVVRLHDAILKLVKRRLTHRLIAEPKAVMVDDVGAPITVVPQGSAGCNRGVAKSAQRVLSGANDCHDSKNIILLNRTSSACIIAGHIFPTRSIYMKA
jgi:hypothetical protein